MAAPWYVNVYFVGIRYMEVGHREWWVECGALKESRFMPSMWAACNIKNVLEAVYDSPRSGGDLEKILRGDSLKVIIERYKGRDYRHIILERFLRNE
jgi:hypothetical protein